MSNTGWDAERIAEMRRYLAAPDFPAPYMRDDVLSLLDELERVIRGRDEAQATISAVVVTLVGGGYRFPVESA